MEISNTGGWISSDEWYKPGHVKRHVLGNWYVFIIITFYFSLLNIIFRYRARDADASRAPVSFYYYYVVLKNINIENLVVLLLENE